MTKRYVLAAIIVTGILAQGCGPIDLGGKKEDKSNYTVGGTVTGLSGTLVLQNNGGDDRTVTASGAFTFPAALADGSTYSVTVKTQPTGQTCTVTNGTGTISGSNVTNVAVACAASAAAFDFTGTTSPGDNTIYMAKNSSLSIGDIIAIDVKSNNISSGVFGAAFDVDFDSSKITYDSYVAGNFLEQGGATVHYEAILQSDNSSKLVAGITRQTGTATGSGTLITLKFKVTSGSTVGFSRNELRDQSNLTILGTTWSGGTVTVQ